MRNFILPLWVAIPAILLDQATKFFVWRYIPYHGGFSVIPNFFEIVHVRNTGAAFGMWSDNNAFFIGLASVATVVVLATIWKGAFSGRMLSLSAGLLLGGIVGNLVDRLVHGNVVDFLSFQLGRFTWPAFNVADSCICIAAGLMMIHAFFMNEPRKPRKAQKISGGVG